MQLISRDYAQIILQLICHNYAYRSQTCKYSSSFDVKKEKQLRKKKEKKEAREGGVVVRIIVM